MADDDAAQDIQDVDTQEQDTGFENQAERQAAMVPPIGGMGTARNQPMEIPASATGPMGGGPLAGAMGAGLGTARPVGSMVTQQHGGLVTGLAGLLVDGLYAGMAPSREAAFEMPMKLAQMRQQQAETAIKQQQMQEEMQEAPIRMKLQLAQTQMIEMNLHKEAMELGLQDKLGVAAQKFAEKSIEGGTAEQIGTTDTYEQAMQGVQNLNAQNQDHQLKLFAYPLTGDVEGKWGIYKAYPDKTLPFDMDIPVGVSQENPSGILHIPAGTPQATAGLLMRMGGQQGVEHTKAQAALQKQWYVGIDTQSGGKKLVRGDQLESANFAGDGVGTPVNQQQINKWGNDMASIQQGQISLNRYQSAYEQLNPALNPEQREAVRVLTEPDEENAGSLMHVSIKDAEDFITGKPGTGYGSKVIKSKTLSDQWDKAGPEGQQLVNSYYSTVVSNLAFRRAQMGSAPRQAAVIAAEMALVPRPGMPQGQGQSAFKNSQEDLANAKSAIPFNITGIAPAAAPQEPQQGQPEAPPQSIGTPPQSSTAPPSGDTKVNLPVAPGATVTVGSLKSLGFSDAEIQKMVEKFGIAQQQ